MQTHVEFTIHFNAKVDIETANKFASRLNALLTEMGIHGTFMSDFNDIELADGRIIRKYAPVRFPLSGSLNER